MAKAVKKAGKLAIRPAGGVPRQVEQSQAAQPASGWYMQPMADIGKMQQVYVKQANQWRDYLNPLRALTMQRLVSYLEQAQRGAYAELQWFFHLMEPADATVAALITRRIGAIKRLDADFRDTPEDDLPPGATKAMVDEQHVACRQLLDQIDNMREAIEFLALATFRQFSHLEKHYVNDVPLASLVKHLEPVPQWYWVRLGLNGLWQYNERAVAGLNQGQDIEPSDFVIREVERAVNWVASRAFVRKGLSQKDYDAFIEIFGIPMIFVLGPPNVPKEKEGDYLQLAEQMIGNGRGYLPNGSDVKNPGAEVRGTQPFREHLKYQDEQIVLAGTGGLLTMLTESGSGTLAGSAHRDTFEKIADAEGKEISEILQRQLFDPLLDEKFPDQPHLVRFELAGGDPVGTTLILDHAGKAKAAGVEIDVGQLSEKTGYKLTKVAAAPGGDGKEPLASLGSELQLANRQLRNSIAVKASAGVDKLVAAQAEDFAPILKLIEALPAVKSPDEFAKAIKQIQKDLAALKLDPKTSATAKALESALAKNFVTALKESPHE
jgi:phage gp29-like protein